MQIEQNNDHTRIMRKIHFRSYSRKVKLYISRFHVIKNEIVIKNELALKMGESLD